MFRVNRRILSRRSRSASISQSGSPAASRIRTSTIRWLSKAEGVTCVCALFALHRVGKCNTFCATARTVVMVASSVTRMVRVAGQSSGGCFLRSGGPRLACQTRYSLKESERLLRLGKAPAPWHLRRRNERERADEGWRGGNHLQTETLGRARQSTTRILTTGSRDIPVHR